MSSFWKDKKVLVTGHSGFKGAWLSFWLHKLGADVTGISLPPTNKPNLFTELGLSDLVKSQFIDINNYSKLLIAVRKSNPDIIFHLAAQALVPKGYEEPLNTFETNFMGTVNLLNSLREARGIRVGIFITTDKVYDNKETYYPYRETDNLGGFDPYSASKAASEIATSCFRDSFFKTQNIAIATARAGNVIGGGDWAEHRLIPDLIRAWENGESLVMRSPHSLRPWQHVLEPLHGYLSLAEELWKKPQLAGPFNFGPDPSQVATVQDVTELASSVWGKGASTVYNPDTKLAHEAKLLSLDNSKSRAMLDIKPTWSLNECIQKTISWYKKFNNTGNANDLCLKDIAEFENIHFEKYKAN